MTLTATQTPEGADAAKVRVYVASQREICRQAAWGSLYEFEDVICEVDDVRRIDLQPGPGFAWRSRAISSLVWRQISELSARMNPGLRPVSISECDVFVFACINPWELLYLNAIRGWRENCRKKICYMYEMWGGIVDRYRHLLSLLNGFDQVVFGWKSSAEAVQRIVDVPCHHLSPAVDALRFSPHPNPPPRSIDVYSLGRRVESVHRELLQEARKRQLFYIYDTLPGKYVQPTNYVEHRELFANLGKRTRYFLTYPAKVDKCEETRGISEAGTRFYEGTATGAVLVGQRPDSDAFKQDFNWPDSVIDIGNGVKSLLELMDAFARAPEEFEKRSRRNAVEALSRHDWAYRWGDILNMAGMKPTPQLDARRAQLNKLAGMAAESPAHAVV